MTAVCHVSPYTSFTNTSRSQLSHWTSTRILLFYTMFERQPVDIQNKQKIQVKTNYRHMVKVPNLHLKRPSCE